MLSPDMPAIWTTSASRSARTSMFKLRARNRTLEGHCPRFSTYENPPPLSQEPWCEGGHGASTLLVAFRSSGSSHGHLPECGTVRAARKRAVRDMESRHLGIG